MNMENQDTDRLLEQGLSGEPPREMFHARALRDSTAALVRARRGRTRWRLAAPSLAAAFLAAVSFLAGRYSAPQPATPPPLTEAGDMVAVSNELVVWLDAARLFKHLGMEDRMKRALDCASRLLPREAMAAGAAAGSVFFAASGDGIDGQGRQARSGPRPGASPSVDSMNRILAEFLGGYDHASTTD
jgi:hypothetical protein